MNKLFIVVSFVTALLGAKVSASPPRGGQETGTIIVYRESRLTGFIASVPLRLDDGPQIKLRDGCYLRFEVTPGQHTIVRQGGLGKDVVGVRIESGQTVYVEAHYGWVGPVFEVADNQKQARAEVATLKLQE
jgi:hypothetical protein